MKLSNLIVERLTSVNQDVDMIYKQYFKDAYDYIKQTGEVDHSLLRSGTIGSDVLRSRMAKKADQLNHIKINLNNGRNNTYTPKAPSYIDLNIHTGAWQLAEQFGSIENAAESVGSQRDMFLTEFEPYRMKGTIHHELNHWIDDTLHNNHIEQHVNKSVAKGRPTQDNQGPIERNSQIHNIVQLKRHLKGEWDTLSFDKMVQMIPGLLTIADSLSPEEYNKWKRNLLNRMAREGLLGAGMRRAA